MYSDLSQTLTKEVDALTITWGNDEIPKYWYTEQYEEKGVYCRVSEELVAPVAQSLGSAPPVSLTGFIQFMVMVPRTDRMIRERLAVVAKQIFEQYPIESKKDGKIKLSYNGGVENAGITSSGGYSALTMRVNFSADYCGDQ